MLKPLTEDEILELVRKMSDEEVDKEEIKYIITFVRIIEKAHGI